MPWYVAVWAEASVLNGYPDASERLRRARQSTHGNGIAATMVRRAAAIYEHRAELLDDIAHRFTALGCIYQAQRTTALARQVFDLGPFE